ncbi:sensor histidine kinase [Enterococcus mundtii]|uniref:sensor histidine kinase n=1 Tax=Enterococcus mundtii TaxID=53346 RepID=UPI000DFDBCFC|nr:histidine kinase [Enterococcus mundtii]STD25971.1 two-component system sensor histidine kinase [Enterococcus mundtii]
MQAIKLSINLLSIIGLIGLMIYQTTSTLLMFVISLSMVWLTFFFLGESFQKHRPWFVALQLISVLLSLIFVEQAIFLLPLSLLQGYFCFQNSWLLLFVALINYSVGSFFLSDSLYFLFVLWVSGMISIVWSAEKMMKQQEELTTSSDFLRIERNKLSKLFTQSTLNAEAMQKEATLVERQRIIHEIHDHLGHNLTSCLIQIEAAKVINREQPEQAHQLLSQSADRLRKSINEVRNVLHEERPKNETLNINKVKAELQRFSETHQIIVDFQYSGSLDKISRFHWQVLAANLKEFLTNTLKYSEASTVTVRLHVYQKFLRFESKNNGKRAIDYRKGLGIVGMEERTAVLNGKLLIDGTDGFHITTILPFDEEHEISNS